MFLTNWIKKANLQFRKNRPLDSEHIQWEVGVDGMRPILKLPSSPIMPSGEGGAAGVSILWAKITSVSDVNNYLCDIWSSRSSYVMAEIAVAEDKWVRVPDIVDSLFAGDNFGVVTSTIVDDESPEDPNSPSACDADTTDTIIKDAGNSFTADQVLKMTSGDASGDIRKIASAGSGLITLVSALSATPATNDTFEVYEGIGYDPIQQMGVMG